MIERDTHEVCDEGAQRVGMADERDHSLLVGVPHTICRVQHPGLDGYHPFPFRRPDHAANLIESLPRLILIQFRKLHPFPVAKSHLSQGLVVNGPQVVRCRNFFRCFNRPFQRAGVNGPNWNVR